MKRLVLPICLAVCCVTLLLLSYRAWQVARIYSQAQSTVAAVADVYQTLRDRPPMEPAPKPEQAPEQSTEQNTEQGQQAQAAGPETEAGTENSSPEQAGESGESAFSAAALLRRGREALQPYLDSAGEMYSAYKEKLFSAADAAQQEYEALRTRTGNRLPTWENAVALGGELGGKLTDELTEYAVAQRNKLIAYIGGMALLLLFAVFCIYRLARAVVGAPGALLRAGLRSRTETRCPFCAETIKKKALLCKHCGRDISGA